MYVPASFAEDRPEILARFVAAHGFATLVTQGEGGLVASHIPLLHDAGRGLLTGHIAKPNPQAAHLQDGAEALAIFAGPHAYISPRWYENHPAVPTWNYAAVHVYGRVRRIEEPGDLARIVATLAATYEAGSSAPWRYADLPTAFAAGMLKGILGFKLAITRLEGKFKLSQNRAAADRAGVVAALRAAGRPEDEAVADLMAANER